MVLVNRCGVAISPHNPAKNPTMSKTTTPLTKNWTFARASDKDSTFRPVASVPTEIFLDLLAHKLIPDPFQQQNEIDVQWVGEEDWIYRVSFPSPACTKATTRTDIVFEGLDTYATVTLNGREILHAENMFTPYRVDVTGTLHECGENELTIVFESAFLRGKKVQEKWPDFYWGSWNGDASRLVVRKAQYHYGWDWGPMLMTCGPWKPVYLETFTSRIDELYFTAHVPESLKTATISATAEVVGTAEGLVFTLTGPDGKKVKTTKVEVVHGKATAEFKVKDPELWYPHGYGAQSLYKLSAALDGELDEASKTLGLRRALVQQKPLTDAEGLSFYFEINNIPIWAGGSNWVPVDSFLTRPDVAKYRSWLELAKDGRQVMIRVWGGGIYEHDSFYDICDELGLLVWQDFAFGCGNYPAMIPEFRKSVKAEAIANVKRLRHHPSIVIYAGNNEDYSLMWGIKGNLGYDPHDKDPENWLKTGFPARYIYEKILPEAVAAHSPGTFYHPSCPYGNAERPDGGSMIIGDTHQWNVWHGTQEPYQNWDLLAGRFVSEFGMEAYPSLTTIDSYLPPDGSERTPFSPTIEFHNKALGACRRIACYLTENILYDHHPLEAYIYSTQLMQAEALSTAYRFWRRNWKGPGRELTSGALVWQLNDCWPATSWSIIDYHLRPKAAYFAIKRELAPIVLGSKRYEVSTPRDKYTNAHVSITHRMQVWVSSFLLEEQTGPYKLVSKTFHVTSGHLIVSETLKHDFSLHPNRSTELVDILLPGINGNTHLDVVVALYLLDPSGQHVARNISWPDPLKYVKVSPKPGVGALLWRGKLRVRAELPVKGMVFMGEEMEWGDNCVDLVPGEILQVSVKTEGKKKEVGVRFYGGGEKGVGVSVATEGEWEGVVVG